jgi:excisionase family DNA binding protein
MVERLITPEDAADRLAVSKNTILDWLRSGQLKGVKAGRLWRLRERDLAEFLKEPEPAREMSHADDRSDRFCWTAEDQVTITPAPEEASGAEIDDVMNWERYDALKAQGLSRRAIAREMRIAESTLRRLEKRRLEGEKEEG